MNENINLPEEELTQEELDQLAEMFGDVGMENIITLADEEGNEVSFYFLDMVEYEGDNYAVTCQIVDGELEEQATIFRVTVEEDGEAFDGIDDEDLLRAVFDIFQSQMEGEVEEEDLPEQE